MTPEAGLEIIPESRHVGIVVTDMAEALAFYRGLLGLPVISDEIEEGDYFDRLVGLDKAKARIVKLKTSNSMVELLQYLSHTEPAPVDIRSSAVGCSHIAFTVKDVCSLYELLLAHGHECNAPPLEAPGGRVKVAYCHGPDGTLIELVEILS
jgi:glyoxylase I family protein